MVYFSVSFRLFSSFHNTVSFRFFRSLGMDSGLVGQLSWLESLLGGCDLTLQSLEALHITETLRRHGGNRDAAAKSLGIHRATLFRKIKLLGISAPDAELTDR